MPRHNRNKLSANLLHSQRPIGWRRWKKHIIIASSIVLFLMILCVVTIPSVVRAMKLGNQARVSLTNAQNQIEQQDFSTAIISIDSSTDQLQRARRALNSLSFLRILPFAGTQVRAAQTIIDIGIDLTRAIHDGVLAADQILGPIQQSKGNISLASLTPADKRQVLDRLSRSGPLLQSVSAQLASAVQRFDEIPDHGLLGPLQSTTAQFRSQLPFLRDTITQLVPTTRIVPAIAGFPDPKNYLFLMENNTELRPGGGFIGTFGILKVSSGEVTSFETSDVYALDRPVENTLNVTPPTPLTRYNSTKKWFFRDSNWSPDFPTDALKALEFYRLENGKERQLDGVIAVTPTFITSLLRLSGDITVNGVTFTPENLTEKLQPRADRKELVGEMGKVLINRILALPQRRWQELFSSLTTALEEKQLLLYSKDPTLQQDITQQNWGGAMREARVDSLFVVDANLAALKTDQVMQRDVSYTLDATGDQARATVTVSYVNHGSFGMTTSRYRSFTRIYVPIGSTLESSEGALTDDKIRGGKPTQFVQSEDLQRSVFSGFFSVEPGETHTIAVTYTLPSGVQDAIRSKQYELVIQKEAGTLDPGLTVSLTFPDAPLAMQGVDGMSRVGHTGVALKTDLRQDRQLTVGF